MAIILNHDCSAVHELAFPPTEDKAIASSSAHFEMMLMHKTSKLESLPSELLLMIASHLSDVQRLALSYVSHHLSDVLNTTVAKVIGPTQTLLPSEFQEKPQYRTSTEVAYARNADPKRAQRLELLSLLDRDRPFFEKPICSACVTTHHRSQFTNSNLRLGPLNRECIGSAGCMWICPHLIIDHDFTKTDRSLHVGSEEWSDFPQNRILPRNSCRPCLKTSLMKTRLCPTSAVTTIPMVIVDNLQELQSCNISSIVGKMSVFVCPHIGSGNNHGIIQNFQPRCRKLEPHGGSLFCFKGCDCDTCPKKGRVCHICHTSAHWRVQDLQPGFLLLLIITRELGQHPKITDSQWTSQLVQPEEFDRLDSEWSMMASAVDKGIDEAIDEIHIKHRKRQMI